MNVSHILAQIDAEIARLQDAKVAIEAIAGTSSKPVRRGPGRPPKSVSVPAPARRAKRTLSPEARAKIAAAQKARWAKAKKTASKKV